MTPPSQMCQVSRRDRGPWHRYGCGARGYHEPVPFATGALQVMSVSLLRRFAYDEQIGQFVARAGQIDLNLWGGSEDVAMGFALSRLGSRRRLEPLPDSAVTCELKEAIG